MEKKDLELCKLKKELSNLKAENLGLREAIQGALSDIRLVLNAKSFKIIHLLGRIKDQFFLGKQIEKNRNL